MIDTHCHIDMYPNPKDVANQSENLGIVTIAMTNLPSHFEMGYKHLLGYKKVRLALGLHPLYAKFHKNEYQIFLNNIDKTSYLGEVGLDFSKEGLETKNIQIEYFQKVLSSIKDKKKLVSLHSRRAEKEVLTYLNEYKIKAAIFHWYSGPLKLIDNIISDGYYFSVNPAMVNSENGKKIIQRIPKEFFLTESDGPFTSLNGKPCTPSDIAHIYSPLSQLWKIPISEVELNIKENFHKLISYLK